MENFKSPSSLPKPSAKRAGNSAWHDDDHESVSNGASGKRSLQSSWKTRFWTTQGRRNSGGLLHTFPNKMAPNAGTFREPRGSRRNAKEQRINGGANAWLVIYWLSTPVIWVLRKDVIFTTFLFFFEIFFCNATKPFLYTSAGRDRLTHIGAAAWGQGELGRNATGIENHWRFVVI